MIRVTVHNTTKIPTMAPTDVAKYQQAFLTIYKPKYALVSQSRFREEGEDCYANSW
jgi:hypothetical protein